MIVWKDVGGNIVCRFYVVPGKNKTAYYTVVCRKVWGVMFFLASEGTASEAFFFRQSKRCIC
ncbi:MAG: hypothetical protein KBA08_01735 [Firmicutes bacterium]|nr:hypothetical protein [Bacillota bacterium]